MQALVVHLEPQVEAYRRERRGARFGNRSLVERIPHAIVEVVDRELPARRAVQKKNEGLCCGRLAAVVRPHEGGGRPGEIDVPIT
jgi:hypothetical protein